METTKRIVNNQTITLSTDEKNAEAAFMVTFKEAMVDADEFTLSPGKKTENSGFFTNSKVDRDTVPDGWYAYDVRHGDSGNFCSVESSVLVNHAGTFLTQTPVKFGKLGYRSLTHGGGYTF